MDKGKSLARAKSSTTSLAGILAKEGLSTLIPGASLTIELTKLLCQHGQTFYVDRLSSRIERFHTVLLEDKIDDFSAPNDQEFLNQEFDTEDYYDLLESCVKDREAEKTDIYANLMRSLIDRRIDRHKRREFIELARELNNQELNFLRARYIQKNFRMMNRMGGTDLKRFMSKRSGSSGRLANKLAYNGLVDEDKGQLSSLAVDLLQLIYPESELRPESIGQVEASGIHILIICYRLDEERSLRAANALADVLHSYQITSSLNALSKESATNAAIMSSAGVLICDDSEFLEKHLDRKALLLFSEKRPLYKLNIAKNQLHMDSVTFNDEYDLSSTDKKEMMAELSEYMQLMEQQANENS